MLKIHGVLEFKEVNFQFSDNDIFITKLLVQISIKIQSTPIFFTVIFYFAAYIFFTSPLKQ